MAKNVHQLKEKLDKYGNADRTTGVKLTLCIQLGELTFNLPPREEWSALPHTAWYDFIYDVDSILPQT